MEQRTVKIIYDAHSWTGIGLGLILFIISFTGVIALFVHEIDMWDNESLRYGYEQVGLDVQKSYETLIEAHSNEIDFITVEPATYYKPVIHAHVGEINNAKIKTHNYNLNAKTSEFIGIEQEGLSFLFGEMHRDLMLPSPWGRYLIGIMGCFFFFSIVSGVIIHRNIMKEFLTFRPYRSIRLLLSDTHKSMSVWGLLFHTMISFTGAALGLAGILLIISAGAAYKGDVAKASAEVLGNMPIATGNKAPPMDFNLLKKIAFKGHEKAHILAFRIHNVGDENAYIVFSYSDEKTDQSLLIANDIIIHAVTGEIIQAKNWFAEGIGMRAYMSIAPLHYANFGGIWIKFLYAALGLSTALLSVSGAMLWMERRARDRKKGHYRITSAAFIGVCCGLPLATVVAFYAARVWTQDTSGDRFYMISLGYFGSWVLTILVSFFVRNEYSMVKYSFLTLGGLLLVLPVMNYFCTGDYILNSFQAGLMPVAITDICIIVVGICALYVSNKLPKKRNVQISKLKFSKDIVKYRV